MTVKSADKKPEKYVGPDGKTKIRMVPMDKEVVKSEAYDEPQGQAKRMMSPLQKVRMDKEKADRDRDGKLKSTNKTLKALRKEQVKINEANALNELTAAEKKLVNQMYDKKGNLTPLGKKVMDHGKKSSGMKEEVKQVDEVSADKLRRYVDKNNQQANKPMKITSNPNDMKKQARTMDKRLRGKGMAVDKMLKMYGRSSTSARVSATEEVKQVDEISKKTAQSYLDKTKGDDAFSGTRKANNRLKGAINAVGKLRKKESVDEVLDTPGAIDKYHNKAKAQSDRARNSATAKIVRGTKDISKEKDVIRKREKGMDMATNVRAKQFRKAVTGKPYGEAVAEAMNPYLKHPTNKLKDKHASFSRQIGDLQTKKLKGAKNPSIDQEIAKYQQKLTHVKNAMKNESIEEAEAPKKKKYLSYKDMKKAIASIKPSKKKPTLPKAPWDK